jgi:hypothetical protein
VKGEGSWAEGVGFRIQILGFRGQGKGCRVRSQGLGDRGYGLRVIALGFRDTSPALIMHPPMLTSAAAKRVDIRKGSMPRTMLG